MHIPQDIFMLRDKLNSKQKNLYIVGGFIRDHLLGVEKTHPDIDLATDATPEEIQSVLIIKESIGKKYGTFIVGENTTYELTSFRSDIGILDNRRPTQVIFTDSLHEDAGRRDFTINSVYYDLQRGEYIDPHNGRSDAREKLLRFIGDIDDRLQEDALRILRAIRFKNEYGLNFAQSNYFAILKSHIKLLHNISAERIKDELDKMLLGHNPLGVLDDLKAAGFFAEFLPEVEKLEKTPGGPPYHLEGNVWIHTKMVISEFLKIKKIGKPIYGLDNNKATQFTETEILDYMYTLLFHDIAKFYTYSQDDKGQVHYYNHENLGVEKLQDIFNRLPFSNKSKKKISCLIENHLRIFLVTKMRKLKARRFMMHPRFEDLMIVGMCDHRGRIPSSEKVIIELETFYEDFLHELQTKVFLTGDDIIKKYPHLSGGEIGKKLREENDKILLS